MIPHQRNAEVWEEKSGHIPERYNKRTEEGRRNINDLHSFQMFRSKKELKKYGDNLEKNHGHQWGLVCGKIENLLKEGKTQNRAMFTVYFYDHEIERELEIQSKLKCSMNSYMKQALFEKAEREKII